MQQIRNLNVKVIAAVAIGLVAVAFIAGRATIGNSQTTSDDAHSYGAVDSLTAHDFSVEADPSSFSGPVPFKVDFSSSIKNAHGVVSYEWNFDDGTKERGSRPSHTFTKPGWRIVKVNARDAKGNKDFAALQMRVWSRKQWNELTDPNVSPAKQQAAIVANLKQLEKKLGVKIPGISAAPLEGEQPLTPESLAAQQQLPELKRKAQERELKRRQGKIG